MNPLRIFTARGVGLLCAGAAATAGGFALGERDLVGVGVLVLLLPLLSVPAVLRGPRRVAHSRALRPDRVAAGTDARVLVRVANSASVLPIGGLLVEDGLPYALGERPRFTIGHLGPRGVRDLAYRVRTQARGLYPIGPLRVSFTDPLGCVRVRRDVGGHMSLLVTPPVVDLDDAPPRGGAAEGGDSTGRTMAGGGHDDPVPRAYRHGDDLRRVHWRSTARHGELMVRREEQQWSDRSTVLVDTRRRAHAGAGPDASVETAVAAAASVTLHLLGRFQDVRLLTDAGEIAATRPDAVLDALAVAPPSENASLADGADLLAAAPVTGTGLVVAVLGALGPDDVAALGRVGAARDHPRVAVLCGTAAWPAPDAALRAGEALSESGWTVLEIASPRDLAGAWRRLPLRSAPLGGTR
ncbi:DUF58 domain-containing protein [Nocardiopsis trehalosi]|uniref:DUF58 domain-containing protein n=1 Tax=Nocardiopsis trehalosi TaxID=109329 RepID=UPI000A01190A|nr:DUF58 domain-containing protein [Nocardiopsis trehalosi]